MRTYCTLTVILFFTYFFFGCVKRRESCSKMGYEYSYFKFGTAYSPLNDSIPLGSEIILEASAPKVFYDDEKQLSVTLNQSLISGPLTIKKVSNDQNIPIIGAIDDIEFTSIIGQIIKDSTQFSQGQLKIFRTAHFSSIADSFKLKTRIKPKITGVYFIGLGQQSNRDADCALYKYFLKIKNSDQHLNYLAQFNNGFVTKNDSDYTYCIKVY